MKQQHYKSLSLTEVRWYF